LHGGHFGARGCGAAVAAPSRRPRLGPARSGRLADIDELTVASLNLHRGFGFFGQPFDVAAALCQLEAETVCVQESWQPDSAEGDSVAEAAGKLGASLRRTTMLRPASLSLPGVSADSGPGDLAIAVLTTLPVTDYAVIELGRAPADDVPRFAQVLTLALAGGTSVRVVNTHLTHRLTSPLQLRNLRQRLRAGARQSDQLPTIVVGDLNMPRPLAALSLAYGPTVRGRTWPATRPLIQLDHILTDRNFKVIESAVLPHAGSDHLPIRARLRILPPR
jgi:endonuclease/exonuclease/phosphatase family metal-dependent hydrolase